MSDSLASDNNQLDDSPAVDITGKIMVVIIILLFMVIVTFLFFHLFAKGFWWTQSRSSDSNSQSRRRRRSVQEGGGLDPSVLNSLPISIFNSKEDGLDLECSVCLSEVVEGEKVRVLPKCNHRFHIDCIDMWFHSHSTCPLCRTTLAANPPPSSVVVEVEVESSTSAAAAFPTNVLIWGNHNQITSSSSSTTSEQNTSSSSYDSDNAINNNSRRDDEGNGMLRIDIPSECEATTSSSSPLASAEGRLKSLKRLLSSSSRGIMSLNPWSPTSTVQQQTKPKEAAGQS